MPSVDDLLGPPPVDHLLGPDPKANKPAWNQAAIEKALGEPVRVTSTKRDPAHNAAVGGSPTSSHLAGQAIDFVPQDGNVRGATDRLSKAGIPFDQILQEGDHVHVGWGPKGRGQVGDYGRGVGRSAPPAARAPAAGGREVRARSVDEVLGPPPADHLLGPEPAAKPPPRPAARPPAVAARKAAPDSVRSAFHEDVVEPWKKVGADLGGPKKGESFAGGLGRTLKLGPDAVGAMMSSAGFIPDALVARPAADALANNVPIPKWTAADGGAVRKGGGLKLGRQDPAEVSKATRSDINQALGAVRPGKGLSKLPDFGQGFAPLPPKIRAPKVKEPIIADPAGQFRPSEPEKPGPAYGAEAAPKERLDNALHRLRTRQDARKVQALQDKKKLQKTFGDTYEAEGENLSHELEHALVDPKRELSERGQAALQFVKKAKDRQRDAINRSRRLAAKIGMDDTAFADYSDDQGYVPRQVKGLSPAFDGLVNDARDPVTGRGLPLNKSTSALKSRSDWRMLQPVGKGEPLWVSKAMAKENPGRYDKIGATIKGSNGQKYRIRQPTMAEIEKHTANDAQPTTYHKNYFDLIHDAAVRAEQVADNLDVLHASLTDLKSKGLAHREEWMRPETTARGAKVYVPTRGKPAPEGFVGLDHIPQLKGWKFDPSIAEVFKDYKPGPGEDLDHLLTKINSGLTSTLFWNPIGHSWNVANDWAKARGWDWLPGRGGYASLIRNGAKAAEAVITKNGLYKQLLNEGASLMSASNETRNFHDLMLQKGVKEISGDRTALSTLMHSFDLKGLAPQKLIAHIYKAAGDELWRASDILMTQRVLELQDRGLPIREAIKQAERDIANYRVPSRVMGSRALSQAIRNPNMQQFGRYHYNVMKSWGLMFRDLYAGSAEERTAAAGKFLAAMIMAHGAYPIMDAMAKKVTGDQTARVHRGGGLGDLDAVEQLSKGQMDWTAFMSRLVDLPPATRALQETVTNRDAMGQQIRNPELSWPEQAAQVAEHASSYVEPVDQVRRAMKPGGAKKELLRLGLIDTQTEKQQRGQAYGKQRDKKAAIRARREDPILKLLGDLGL